MKRFSNLLMCLIVLAGASFAHVIDGQWITEREVELRGQKQMMSQAYTLKAMGNKLTGSIILTINGQVGKLIEILDGKIDGKKFSFRTVLVTKLGDRKSSYQGEVVGGMIKGAISNPAGNAPFEAKRK